MFAPEAARWVIGKGGAMGTYLRERCRRGGCKPEEAGRQFSCVLLLPAQLLPSRAPMQEKLPDVRLRWTGIVATRGRARREAGRNGTRGVRTGRKAVLRATICVTQCAYYMSM